MTSTVHTPPAPWLPHESSSALLERLERILQLQELEEMEVDREAPLGVQVVLGRARVTAGAEKGMVEEPAVGMYMGA